MINQINKALSLLSGDFNHDNVAECKKILQELASITELKVTRGTVTTKIGVGTLELEVSTKQIREAIEKEIKDSICACGKPMSQHV